MCVRERSPGSVVGKVHRDSGNWIAELIAHEDHQILLKLRAVIARLIVPGNNVQVRRRTDDRLLRETDAGASACRCDRDGRFWNGWQRVNRRCRTVGGSNGRVRAERTPDTAVAEGNGRS